MSNTVPAGWHDNGTELVAPNGHKVVRGFRDHVLQNNWTPDNYPLEDEVGLQHVELAINSGGGTRQIFRTKMLVWYASRGVQEAWIGAELEAWIGLAESLQKESTSQTIVALENKLEQIVKIANE